jgi:hypothetical protein
MAKVLVVADIKQGELKGSTAELLSKAKASGRKPPWWRLAAISKRCTRTGGGRFRHAIYRR